MAKNSFRISVVQRFCIAFASFMRDCTIANCNDNATNERLLMFSVSTKQLKENHLLFTVDLIVMIGVRVNLHPIIAWVVTLKIRWCAILFKTLV